MVVLGDPLLPAIVNVGIGGHEMKKWIAVTMVAGLALSVSAAPLEFWEMDDAAGVDLNDLANSGSIGSEWNFGGANMLTDGSGSFVLAGDGLTTTRKLPKKGSANADPLLDLYATPLTGSDTYTLEMNLSAFDLTAATVGDSINLKVVDSANVMVALIVVEKDSATTSRIRFASANANYRNHAYALSEGAHAVRLEFNLSAGTAEYFIDDVSKNTFSGQTFAGNIGGFTFVKNGSWTNATSSVSIDSMGLSDSVIVPPAEGLYIAQQVGVNGANLAQTNTFASLGVTNGDYVVVGASINKGTWNESNVISFAGSASLGAVVFESAAGSGPNANLWYAPVTSTGTVDVTMTTTVADGTTAYAPVSAYVVRSSTGGVDLLGTESAGSTTNAPSGTIYTNTYDFGTSTTGLFIEAASSYMSDGNGFNSDNPDYVIDQNDGDQRKVGHAVFSGVSTITNIWSGTTNRQAVVLGIAFASGTATTPTSQYDDWMSAYSVGGETGLQDDPDGDLLDNLGEYAFGGEPDNPANQGNTPVQSQVSEGGTNFLEYVYYERDDAADRGLASILEVGTDLVITNWTTAGIEFVGSGASAEPGYNAVTNRISTDDDVKRFLNLQIEFTP
jgi:hypothetical protein